MHLNTDFMGEGHCFVILIVNTNALPTSLLYFHNDYIAQELFVMGGGGGGGGRENQKIITAVRISVGIKQNFYQKQY